MGSFKVVIVDAAVEELRSTPFPFRRQINQRITKLKADPFPSAAELVAEGRYRLNVSDWWLLYEVDLGAAVVRVVAILPAEVG
jgi:mRNA-degrading endonuclease RelE of RelBE toxin-antitoxin system